MTFTQLQKYTEKLQEQKKRFDIITIEDLAKHIQGSQKPFYRWDLQHREQIEPIINIQGYCCYNHIIGLPVRNGVRHPLYNYERIIYKALFEDSYLNSGPAILPADIDGTMFEKRKKKEAIAATPLYTFKNKHLWIKKATGLGITEFTIRVMCYLALSDNSYRGSQMVVVTGPNEQLAIKIITRMKGLFEPLGITFDSKETVLNLNGCEIQAYASNHVDAFRSLTNPKFILLDEADFFRKSEQETVRNVAERYIAKSSPFIVWISTPASPTGLFAKIEKEPFDTCLYKKLFLDYTYGECKIYSKKEIENAKMSPSFPQEYGLQYLGLIGNVFSVQSIERAMNIDYDPDQILYDSRVVLGCDPAFGSSRFAIVGTRFANQRIEVVISEEHERPEFDTMINRIWEINQQYNISTIYVDAANSVIWQSLKRMFKEPHDIKYVTDKLRWCTEIKQPASAYMRVVPVAFSTNGSKMLQHLKALLEDPNGVIAIAPKFDKLLTSLRTAYSNDFKLDKERTEFPDTLDAMRLAVSHYNKKGE
jgi:hypothetical protein